MQSSGTEKGQDWKCIQLGRGKIKTPDEEIWEGVPRMVIRLSLQTTQIMRFLVLAWSSFQIMSLPTVQALDFPPSFLWEREVCQTKACNCYDQVQKYILDLGLDSDYFVLFVNAKLGNNSSLIREKIIYQRKVLPNLNYRVEIHDLRKKWPCIVLWQPPK